MCVAALFFATLLTNAVDIVSAVRNDNLGAEFEITGKIIFPKPAHACVIHIADATGRLPVGELDDIAALSRPAGDVIHVKGVISKNWGGVTLATCQSIDTIGHETPDAPAQATIPGLQRGEFDNQVVRVRGFVRDVFRDEIDPTWLYCSIVSDDSQIYAVYAARTPESIPFFTGLTDAEISLVGVCQSLSNGLRRNIGRTLLIATPSDIRILQKPPEDPFSVKLLSPHEIQSPADALSTGKRRIIGKIIAVLRNADALLLDSDGKTHMIRLANGNPPRYGETVEVVGTPETDLYRINFSNAIWRKSSTVIPFDNKPKDVEISNIIHPLSTDIRKIDPRFHGQTIRLTGKIMDLPTQGGGQGVVTLKCGECTIPVDIGTNESVLHSITIGCVVSVAGTCVVETENWRPYAAFPHTTGITLVVRTPADVVILSRPSWWTPQRLMVVVGILLLVLVAIFIWNRLLQRVIDRKSRQLLKEQVAQIKSELRVDERTHLAVELHDTLSQNLSGVACQIAATKGTLPEGADETARYLETAERMLLSCRTELRRCLWDLRGDTLEETNFTEAIRKTLAPVAIGVETIIRFNVPRSRLSDTTAHAVLCIIRELVANAIRHGKARTVRVAGEFHDGVLSFSVRDDGRGFDPSNCNGPAEGHFGLEGIRERIKHLDGTFAITSEIGKGTRAEVTLASIQPKDEKPEA